MTISEYPIPPTDNPDEEKHRRQIAQALQLSQAGKNNNIIDVTLRASQTTTTVSDARIAFTTFPWPESVTANARAIASGPYVIDSGRVNGSFILTHASDANTDLTFKLLLGG